MEFNIDPNLPVGSAPLAPGPCTLKVIATCNQLLQRLGHNARPRDFVVSQETYDAILSDYDDEVVTKQQKTHYLAILGVRISVDSGLVDGAGVMLRTWVSESETMTFGGKVL